MYIGADMAVSSPIREHVVTGDVDVQIDGAPTHPVVVDARAAFGDVRINAADDVTVEVRTHAEDGDVRVDGADRSGGTVLVGPEGRPDVIVEARVGHGDISVNQYERPEPAADVPPVATVDPSAGQPTDVADGVAMTRDGSIVLNGGEAVIDAGDHVVLGVQRPQDRAIVITTSAGEFKLIPGGLLLTPYGQLIDLTALRSSATTVPTTGAPEPTVLPTQTTGG